MKIRHPQDRADARGAARAHNRAWREAYDDLLPDDVLSGFDPDPGERTVDRWVERFEDHHEGSLVAVDGDAEVYGYALFRWNDTKEFVGEDEAGLKEIYVDPDRWNEGVGTALLESGIDLVPDDRTALKLEVLADNDGGRRFYESRGFEFVEEITVNIAGEDYAAAVYTLDL